MGKSDLFHAKKVFTYNRNAGMQSFNESAPDFKTVAATDVIRLQYCFTPLVGLKSRFVWAARLFILFFQLPLFGQPRFWEWRASVRSLTLKLIYAQF